ncbi:YeeE/YedE family protein [Bartonella sp. HY761]|uniref:YeeE/YedE family protein n=1 Tax=Bartonella sp. HY761 TaxID=2979330 RepID=UPI002201FD46|nr:YeeE/YedE family protein [Bartonella sp. HY761]UXN05463.1 YeeE/YedE family protein [Bartonella sp. HY761]
MYTVVSGQTKKLSAYLTFSKIISILFLLLGAAFIALTYGWRQGLLLLVGGALGITLYHAAFGFTSAWRVFIRDRRGRGLRVQMLMLAIAVCLFFPTLAGGSFFGNPVVGISAPLSLAVIIGAFMFGIGMQLGGGCASGVLFTAGGGSARMLVVLFFFVLGALISTAHAPFWNAVPALKAVSLLTSFGLWAGMTISLALFAIISLLTLWVEKRKYGTVEKEKPSNSHGFLRFLRGPWPLIWGAIALALLNYVTLIVSGRPWTVAGAFPIWGAKIATMLGVDVGSWAFWQNPSNAKKLTSSIFTNVQTVMDFGIIVGAMLAATLAGRFKPTLKMSFGSFCAAIIGGLLLGYGARIAYGCNIGAYFSGIASGSLHGWLWLIAAFFGNIVGVYARPLFGLEAKAVAQSC